MAIFVMYTTLSILAQAQIGHQSTDQIQYSFDHTENIKDTDKYSSLLRDLNSSPAVGTTAASQANYQTQERGEPLDTIFNLKEYHDKGIRGKGIKVAVFDSGLGEIYQQASQTSASGGSDEGQNNEILQTAKVIDFTNDGNTYDTIGHGTFLAGVIGSQNLECMGIAPDAELYILKLFSQDRKSYTSQFIDAFDYVLDNKIDIVNLSNGGIDFLDTPFIDKINELIAEGIIVVSAIGNKGPIQGSLNNPGDLVNVIGVGSLNQQQTSVANFSSRGIATWNLLDSIGIVKPDVLTAGTNISGLNLQGSCSANRGTSVSTAIISGSIALALSQINEEPEMRRSIQNTAFVKNGLIQTAIRFKGLSITEQGAGVFEMEKFFDYIKTEYMKNVEEIQQLQEIHDDYNDEDFLPENHGNNHLKLSIHPYMIDLRQNSTYFLPFSRQFIYSSMMPISFNMTLMNQGSLNSQVLDNPEVQIIAEKNIDTLQNCVKVKTAFPRVIWPYFANFKSTLEVKDSPECRDMEQKDVEIKVTFDVKNLDTFSRRIEKVQYKFIFNYIKTPPRKQRLLFDQFHQLKYPENGYILPDSLTGDQLYEWNGDHIYTNYELLHKYLVHGNDKSPYYVEILTNPYTCFNAQNYGALLIVDIEDYLSVSEMEKLRMDIEFHGLSIVVLADWYNSEQLDKNKFFNNFTFEEWTPLMAGSNVPTLNSLLHPYHIAFGQSVYSGELHLDKKKINIDSGTEIIQFPKDGYLISARLQQEVKSSQLIKKSTLADKNSQNPNGQGNSNNDTSSGSSTSQENQQSSSSFLGGDDNASTSYISPTNSDYIATIGIVDKLPGLEDSGRIVVMTDSNCVDQSEMSGKCQWLFYELVNIATRDSEQQEDTDQQTSSLLKERFKIPQDFQRNERITYRSLEDYKRQNKNLKPLFKNSYLNSLEQFDIINLESTCKYSQYSEDQTSANSFAEYLPYQHEHSEGPKIDQWNVSPTSTGKEDIQRSWITQLLFLFNPALGVVFGNLDGPQSFLVAFVMGLSCLCCVYKLIQKKLYKRRIKKKFWNVGRPFDFNDDVDSGLDSSQTSDEDQLRGSNISNESYDLGGLNSSFDSNLSNSIEKQLNFV